MSELREKIEAILQSGDMFLNPPEDMDGFIDKDAIKQSRSDQILAAFKAHIEEYEMPKNPYSKDSDPYSNMMHMVFNRAIEAYRKALMESLEKG